MITMAEAGSAAKRHAVDFSNVKDRGAFSKKHKPEGDYRAKITAVTETMKDDVPMWCFAFQLEEDRGATYPYYCKLQENQLWKVRNLLIATGKQVPKKRVNVDPNKIIGEVIGITLADAEYEGRMQSEVDAVFPADELADDDEPTVGDDADLDAGDTAADEPAGDEGDDELDLDDL